MNVGTVRKIIETFKMKMEGIADKESEQSSQQLCNLFDDLNDNDRVDRDLGLQVKHIILKFWQQVSQRPVTGDWATNATVSAWLKLQKDLQETKWDIQVAHHSYFYHCLEVQYNQSGDGKIAANILIPVLVRCCRMLGYVQKQEDQDYPFAFLASKIQSIEHLRKAFLIEGIKSKVTSLAALFYLLYHHCSPAQLAILPRLIKYRVNTTDEEIRSETAVVMTLGLAPEKALFFFQHTASYIDGREFITNNTLINLSDSIPNSPKKLLEAITGKQWYYKILKTIRTEELSNSVDPLIKVLEQDFAQQADQSYPAALSFTEKVIRQFTNLPAPINDKLLSALRFFCFDHYMTLCKSNTKNSFFWFSPATKSSTALKLQQQEKTPAQLNFLEWAATQEGRLHHLITLFDDYKKDIELYESKRNGS